MNPSTPFIPIQTKWVKWAAGKLLGLIRQPEPRHSQNESVGAYWEPLSAQNTNWISRVLLGATKQLTCSWALKHKMFFYLLLCALCGLGWTPLWMMGEAIPKELWRSHTAHRHTNTCTSWTSLGFYAHHKQKQHVLKQTKISRRHAPTCMYPSPKQLIMRSTRGSFLDVCFDGAQRNG